MTQKNGNGSGEWIDPDDAPELTQDWFDRANVHENGRLISRGRPKLESPKQQINVRLDRDVLEHLRASGPGWQSRINEMLRRELKIERPTARPTAPAKV